MKCFVALILSNSLTEFSAGLLNVEALQNFVWRVLIPLMRLTQSYHREIVDKVMPKSVH